MATTVTTPAPSNGGGGASDANSLIDSAFDHASSPDAGGGESEVPDTPDELDAPEPEFAEEPADEIIEPDAEVEDALPKIDEIEGEDDLSKPDKVSEDGKFYRYKKSRAEKLVASHQAWQSIQDAIPGATVDQLREHYRAANGVNALLTDYGTGKLEDMDKVLDFLQDESPESATILAMRSVDRLQSTNPDAYQHLSARFSETLNAALYREAIARGDQKLLKLAQNLEYHRLGKFRTEQDLRKRDATEDRRADLDRRERAFNEAQQRDRSQRLEQWKSDTDSAIDTGAKEAAIDEALAPVKKVYGDKPQWKHMRRDLREAIDTAIKSAPEWERQFNSIRKRAEARPSDQGRSDLVSMMKQFATTVAMKNRKAVIDAVGRTELSRSADTHKKLTAAANKREPASAGQGTNGRGVSVKDEVRNGKIKDNEGLFKRLGL